MSLLFAVHNHTPVCVQPQKLVDLLISQTQKLAKFEIKFNVVFSFIYKYFSWKKTLMKLVILDTQVNNIQIQKLELMIMDAGVWNNSLLHI